MSSYTNSELSLFDILKLTRHLGMSRYKTLIKILLDSRGAHSSDYCERIRSIFGTIDTLFVWAATIDEMFMVNLHQNLSNLAQEEIDIILKDLSGDKLPKEIIERMSKIVETNQKAILKW